MKRTGLFLLPLLFVFQFLPVPSEGDHHYIKQRCEQFRYEITVPAHWQTDEVTLEKKHIFVSYSNQSEIRVRAFITDDGDIESTVRKRRWNLRTIDPLLHNIIETGKIRVRKNVRDKLLVFEYRSNNKKILQRTLISRSGEIIYIVDCKSPVRSFYANEKYFNIALSSFSISGETADSDKRFSTEENGPWDDGIESPIKDKKSPTNDLKKQEEDEIF